MGILLNTLTLEHIGSGMGIIEKGTSIYGNVKYPWLAPLGSVMGGIFGGQQQQQQPQYAYPPPQYAYPPQYGYPTPQYGYPPQQPQYGNQPGSPQG